MVATEADPRSHARHQGVVFVVDDDEDVLRSVEVLLEAEGYLVLSARSGEEALMRMKGISGTTVAVVDLMMPTMNGWELLAAMKNDVALSQIPVIICTARKTQHVDGATMVLQKPVTAPAILAAVRGSFQAIR